MVYWSKVMLLAGAIGILLLIAGVTLDAPTVVPGIVLVACAKVGWVALAFIFDDDDRAGDDPSTSGWT